MPLAAKIALGLLVGGAIGYFVSRVLSGNGADSLVSNSVAMIVFGAILGLVIVTVAFRGSSALGATLTTSQEFNEKVVRAEKPVLVDFYADWCPPCRRLMPILNKLEHEYADRVIFYRVNVDRARGLAAAHGIRSIPTVMFYRRGQKVGQFVGDRPEAFVRRELDALLSGS
jgi:thioredoxin 1